MFLSVFLGCDSEDEDRKPQLPEVVTVSDETETVITYTSVQISGTVMETDS